MRGMYEKLQKGCFEHLKLAILRYRIKLCAFGYEGYKGLIELVSTCLLYPELTVLAALIFTVQLYSWNHIFLSFV